MDITAITHSLDRGVEFLQTTVAGLLVVLLFLGVLNLAVGIGQSVIEGNATTLSDVLGLIGSSIDIVLYLFIVVELYKTVVAYVETENVVIAVVDAGLIAVVRQIITFKPEDYANFEQSLLVAGIYALLLVALLIGFLIVRRESDRAEPSA